MGHANLLKAFRHTLGVGAHLVHFWNPWWKKQKLALCWHFFGGIQHHHFVQCFLRYWISIDATSIELFLCIERKCWWGWTWGFSPHPTSICRWYQECTHWRSFEGFINFINNCLYFTDSWIWQKPPTILLKQLNPGSPSCLWRKTVDIQWTPTQTQVGYPIASSILIPLNFSAALGYHNLQLESAAFREEFDPETFEDPTLPNYKAVHKVGLAIETPDSTWPGLD